MDCALRSRRGGAGLAGQRLDIAVSGAPSEGATYIGSSACIQCHGRHRAQRSAHFNGLQVPGVRGDLQDTSARPRFDAALSVARGQPGEYSVTFANQRRAETPVRYDVALTYGGALRRQQFVTRRRHDGGTWSLFVLPMQLNHDGDAAATTSGRT